MADFDIKDIAASKKAEVIEKIILPMDNDHPLDVYDGRMDRLLIVSPNASSIFFKGRLQNDNQKEYLAKVVENGQSNSASSETRC